MSKLMMLSGRMVDPLALAPDDIHIEDIALGLSAQKRFSGQTVRDYSVAEHSVYVARLVAMRLMHYYGYNSVWLVLENEKHRRVVRQALLHDAPEYLLPDLPYTLKILPEFAFYKELDDKIWSVVASRFDVSVEMHPFIKEADKRIAANEKLYLQGPDMPPHWVEYVRQYPAFTGSWDIVDRYLVDPKQARRRFLDFYDKVREA